MKAILFSLCIVLLFSCDSSKNKILNEDVPFDSLAHGLFCSIDVKRQVVLQNDADYQKLWNEVYMNLDQMPIIPQIDLNKYTVIAVFMGAKNSGGYNISIDKITAIGEKLQVSVVESAPGANCVVTEAISKPYDFVKLKKTGKDITFNTKYITKDCQ
jgi:hypothetical protein